MKNLMMENQGGSITVLRDYRKGNWTVQETMVLIEAKKMDEERRMKRQGESSDGRSKPAELRWKWVEDYCWRNGCLRSQNQCNDKWDNLMRDFKKVRDYERRMLGGNNERGEEGSYWKMEKSERKDKNLPSNMLPQIYEALVEVVERKGQRVFGSGGGGGNGGGGASSSNPNIMSSILGQVEGPSCNIVQPVSLPPQLQQHMSVVLPLPPPQPPQQPPPPPPPSLPFSQSLPISDSDTSEYSDSPAKRRRRGEGTSTTAEAGGTSDSQEVGSAISKSVSLIAGAIQASEEREERRHKELLNMHERRLQIEETKAEINRQGISGLVDAINKLSHSVLALAANKNQPTPK